MVVGEPLAQLIACHLRRDPRVQLDDGLLPTAGFERIDVTPEFGRNGNGNGTGSHGLGG